MRLEDYKYWVSFKNKISGRKIKRYKTIQGVIRAFDLYRTRKVNKDTVQDIVVFKKIAQVENSGLDKVLLLRELEKERGV